MSGAHVVVATIVLSFLAMVWSVMAELTRPPTASGDLHAEAAAAPGVARHLQDLLVTLSPPPADRADQGGATERLAQDAPAR